MDQGISLIRLKFYLMKSSIITIILFALTFQTIFGQVPGNLDPAFNIGTGANNWVYSMDQYPGNRVVIAGNFTSFAGMNQSRLAMLTPFGTLDPSFNVGTGADNTVWSVAATKDGKLVIGGNFTSYNGNSVTRIARILPNGKIDTTFKTGTGANNWVRIVIPVDSGKIIVGGEFTSFNNQTRPYLVRLRENGSIDSSFKYATGLNGRILKARLALDGKILIGGAFTQVGAQPAFRICRLNRDGSIDTSFHSGTGSDGEMRAFAFQPDGKTVIGGYTTSYNGTSKNRILRINSNGSIDSTFHNPSSSGPIYDVAMQPNGKFLVCGAFLTYDQKPYPYIVRLNSDGRVDTTFKTGLGPNDGVEYFSQKSTGEIYISGNFTTYNGIQKNRIARIFGDSVALHDTNTVNVIQGKIFVNVDNNCEQSLSEQVQQYKIVKAEPGPYWGNTFSTGHYEIKVDTGAYQVQQVKSSLEQLLETQFCPPNSGSHNAQFSQLGDTVSNLDFSNTVQSCPILKIEVSSNRRRRCFRNNTYITVSNSGTSPSYNVKAYLKLPELVNLISASESFTFLTPDSVYVFSIDSVMPNQIKTIHIVDSVSCVPGVIGIEQCTKVWATPKNTCILSNASWDGVDLQATGQCSNFIPYFKIKNIGNSMTSSRNYLVFADSLLVETNSFTLNAGDSLMLAIAGANPNALVRIEVPQSNNHPFSSFASAIAPCSLVPRPSGFFAESDEDPIEASHCLPIRDSYDPNDKLVYPKGSTANGNVSPGKYFQYTIRFQNTGNDTAYNVVIVDSLDANLDPASFELISSSHPYTFSISGKGNPVLKWKLSNIMLPDSHVNAAASNGFVSFRIRPIATAALGTRIENDADIYFDFNDPVRTNTTVNTLFIPTVTPNVIDSVQVVTQTKKQLPSNSLIQIYPNPTKSKVSIKSPFTEIEFRLLTITGKEVISKRKAGNDIDIQFLPKGVYQIEFTTPAGKSVKKLILE